MDIWILVVALLIIAIVLFILSIYAKDDSVDYDAHFREITNNQSQELQAIKQRLSELESNYDLSYSQSTEVISSTVNSYDESPLVDSPVSLDDVTDITRDNIIELYTRGFTMQEIAFEANVDVPVVQHIIDDYIENR